MKDIVIVGSGGFAREVRMLIDSCNKVENIWNIIGWISNEPVGTMIDQLPVLGNDEWLIKCNREINAVIALGDGNMRKKLVNAYASNSNIIFPSIVSDTAVVGNTVSLGMGSIVSFNSYYGRYRNR